MRSDQTLTATRTEAGAAQRDVAQGLAAALALCEQARALALEAVFTEHAGACMTRAQAVLRDTQMAEDAVQEAFIDYWRHPSRYDPSQDSLREWLVMLTHRKAVDRVRRERRRENPSLAAAAELPNEGMNPFEQALLGVQSVEVRRLLGALSLGQRQAIVLAYWGGYTQAEIAEVTGTPLGTVKTRMRQGLQKLAVHFRTAMVPTCARPPPAPDVTPAGSLVALPMSRLGWTASQGPVHRLNQPRDVARTVRSVTRSCRAV